MSTQYPQPHRKPISTYVYLCFCACVLCPFCLDGYNEHCANDQDGWTVPANPRRKMTTRAAFTAVTKMMYERPKKTIYLKNVYDKLTK